MEPVMRQLGEQRGGGVQVCGQHLGLDLLSCGLVEVPTVHKAGCTLQKPILVTYSSLPTTCHLLLTTL